MEIVVFIVVVAITKRVRHSHASTQEAKAGGFCELRSSLVNIASSTPASAV